MSLSTGDYFSIDSILCEETAVPVMFNVDLSKGLTNILDAPAGAQDVKELPFWLARELDGNEYISASLPKTHSKQTLSKLKVYASHQSLSALSPYYYEFGVGLSEMMGDPDLVQSLMAAFGRRYRDILDRFQNTEDRNAGRFIKTLTLEERRSIASYAVVQHLDSVYNAGQMSSVHHRLWKRRKLEHIEHAPVVQMSKKQRR